MYVLNKLKWICFSIFTLGCFFACSDDQPDHNTPGMGGDATIKLQMYTPSTSIPTATRSSDTDENKITKVKVLVLEKSGSNFIFDYMEDGTEIEQSQSDNKYTTFTADLWSSDDPVKLILIANYNDVFGNITLTKGMSEASLKSLLVDTFDPDMSGYLPLYGEKELPNLDKDVPNTITITMLRAIARVDVNNLTTKAEYADYTQPFELRSVHVYRANDKLQFVPDEGSYLLPPSMTVKSPTIPAGAAFRTVFSREEAVAVDAITKIYVPESETVTGSAQLDGAICLVVGGIYGDDDKETYYRIDFNSGIAGHPFGQVLRNYKYIFNIIQVNDRGEETPGEASEKEEATITAIVQIWDEVTSEMYFGCNCDNNYLGISSRHIILPYMENSEETIYLKSTVDFTIQALDAGGNPTGTTINTAGENLNNGFYTLQLVKNSGDAEDTYRIVMTTNADNLTDANYSGRFRVTTDLWILDVTVEQENYVSVFNSRYVNILTITPLPGDLGASDGTLTDGISGDATRKLLENKSYFSPSGIIPIKGFIIHNFTNDMLSQSDASTMAILSKMLDHIDVVHLPMLCNPSVAASKIIYDWLTEKYYRVLILGTDDDDTNANLKTYFTEDGTWFGGFFIQDLGIMYNFEVTAPFFDGPLGTINPAAGTSFGYVEGESGYTNGYNDATTIPILRVIAGSDGMGMVTHAADTTHGVFYFGESEITSSRGKSTMSAQAAANGTIGNDFDVLMGNIWAWIANRVAQGKE